MKKIIFKLKFASHLKNLICFFAMLLYICFAFCGTLHAAEQSKTAVFPRLENDPKIQTFVIDNPSWQEIFEIALWASGAEASTYDLYIEKINAIAKELKDAMASGIKEKADQKEKAEYILNFLHKNVFKNYSANQTRIDTLLKDGRYNCVSSAVMYSVLAKYAGLDPKGVITADHAFVTITIDDEIIDIETTNKYGFDPGKRKEFQDNFGKATGFAYTPPGNYRNRQTISLLELDSIIIRNRIADLEKTNKFAECIPLAIDRSALLKNRKDPTESKLFTDPNSELQDVLFNLGASYLNKKMELQALDWADTIKNLKIEKFEIDKKRLSEYEVAIVNNMIAKDVRSKKFNDARNNLDKNTDRLDTKKVLEFKGMILEAELTEIVNTSKTDETTLAALKKIDDAASTGLIEKKRIDQLKQIGTQNRVAYYHNTFASHYNKKDLDGAEAVLVKAAAEFPNHKQFLNDQKTLEKARTLLAKQ
ncbi:MAG: hypothetical protein Ta2B_06450 [Termitinemataceae bacterium]|nr:MAG: hypothetical protein Ta2B_06450 [Termitinemataceae bacterium]